MKTTKKEIQFIQQKFAEMQNTSDLVDLLNFAKRIIYGEKCIPFKHRQITFYCNPKRTLSDWQFFNQYVDFEIPKKSGGTRKIHAPKKGLKSVQRALNLILQCVFEPHKAAMGFAANKSIVDNAKIHIHSNYVYNLDLKDFFPSIDQARIWKCFQLAPFNLNKESSIDLEVINWHNFCLKYPNKVMSTFVNTHQSSSVLPFINYYSLDSFLEANPETFEIIVEKNTNKKYVKNNAGKQFDCNPEFTFEKPVSVVFFNENTNSERIIFINLPEPLSDNKEISDVNYEKIVSVVSELEKSIQLNGLIFNIRKPYVKYVICNHEKDDYKTSVYKPTFSRIEIANKIAAICCTEMEVERLNGLGEFEKVKRNVLPQGAPTSPTLTNIVCYTLDRRLTGLAKRFGLLYSRYADDITFSSMHNVYQNNSDFLKELDRIITDQRFQINPKKTRLQKEGYKKEVTGLLVHNQVNVPKNYIKQLRVMLHNWETLGYPQANLKFQSLGSNPELETNPLRSLIIRNKKPQLKKVVEGKLNYLRMVKGPDNEMYLKLRNRFDSLIETEGPINELLKVWENQGIDRAMNIYYNNKFD